jgi:hypothetical protein
MIGLAVFPRMGRQRERQTRDDVKLTTLTSIRIPETDASRQGSSRLFHRHKVKKFLALTTEGICQQGTGAYLRHTSDSQILLALGVVTFIPDFYPPHCIEVLRA